MNKADSERIANYLENLGYIESPRNEANLVVLTTCGVRQSAEDRIYGLIPKIKKENKKSKIILTGCLSEREDVHQRLSNQVDIWLPIKELPKLAKRLGFNNINTCTEDYLKLKAKYSSKISAFVPIGNGCNNFCSYCVVPYARGREVYRPADDIISEVQSLINKGYKEITLIAQNVNSYYSENIDFSKLLRKINELKGSFWIRFATSHPKDMSDDLISAVAECKHICNYIHLPAQAGDDEVLARMNRKYNRKHYLKLIKKIKKQIPDVFLSTDIIVGFPGETKKQFNKTKKLFKKVKYDLAYIAQYSPRYGTASYKLKDDVPAKEKKRREEELMKILRKTALKNNRKYLNKIVEVLVENKNKNGKWCGKTANFRNVKINNVKDEDVIGKFLKVKITKIKDFGLEGEKYEE